MKKTKRKYTKRKTTKRKYTKRQPIDPDFEILDNWKPKSNKLINITFPLNDIQKGKALRVPVTKLGASKLPKAVKEWNEAQRTGEYFSNHTERDKEGNLIAYIALRQK